MQINHAAIVAAIMAAIMAAIIAAIMATIMAAIMAAIIAKRPAFKVWRGQSFTLVRSLSYNRVSRSCLTPSTVPVQSMTSTERLLSVDRPSNLPLARPSLAE